MMCRLPIQYSAVFAMAAACLVTGSANGDFVPVEDFEGLVLGPIDEQNGWTARHATSVVTTDPIGGPNQVLAVETDSTYLFKETLILNGTVRMLFLRFRFADLQNYSFGLSDSSYPDQFGNFESELSMTNSSNDLRINDGGTYDVVATPTPNTWYNVWMLINNSTDDTQVYMNAVPGGHAAAGDLLDFEGQTVFEFRDVTAGNLLNFFIKTGGGSGPSGPLHLDDIYLENTNALNLRNPIGFARGDVNCDGEVDFGDINPFILALTNPAGYQATFPNCSVMNADINGDGLVDFADINPFVSLLAGP